MDKQIIITKPTGNWLFGFRQDGADRSMERVRTVDGDGNPFEDYKYYTIYQWQVGAPVELVYNHRTIQFKPNTRGNCGCAMPCTSLDAYVTALGWYTRNMPIAQATDFTHFTVGKIVNGVYMPMAFPKELLTGGSGGSSPQPVPPAGGYPDQTLTVDEEFFMQLTLWENAQTLEVSGLPEGVSYDPVLLQIKGKPKNNGVANALVTGVSAANQRVPLPLKLTVQPKTQTFYIQKITAEPSPGGTAVILNITGSGPMSVRVGPDGSTFYPATKVGETLHRQTLGGLAAGVHPIRVRVDDTAIFADFDLDLTSPLAAPLQVYPTLYDLLRLPNLKTLQVSSGGDPTPLTDDNAATTFATDNELEPAIYVPSLVNTEGTRPNVDTVTIDAVTINNWKGVYIMASPDATLSPTAALLDNLSRPGVKHWIVPSDLSVAEFTIQLDGGTYKDLLIQKPGTGVLDAKSFSAGGSYPAINHAPTIAAIAAIVRSEGQSLAIDLKQFISDQDGDNFTIDVKLGTNLDLPSWLQLDANGNLTSGSLPWLGGDTQTSQTLTFTVIARDTPGAQASRQFELTINRVNTLADLESVQINYDSNNGTLSIAIDYPGSGFLQGNVIGVGQSYNGGWRTPTLIKPYDFPLPYTRIIDYYSGVVAGTYEIQLRTQDSGPAVFTRTVTIGAGGKFTVYTRTASEPTGVKIMPVGDSLTAANAYQRALKTQLVAAGRQVQFVGTQGDNVNGFHEGHVAYKIHELTAILGAAIDAKQPGIFIVMAGTNDMNANYQVANAPIRMGQLIDLIYAKVPTAEVYVCQLPPSQNPTNSARIVAFNEALLGVIAARQQNGRTLKLISLFSRLNTETDYADDTHPNADGYTKIGQAIFEGMVAPAQTPQIISVSHQLDGSGKPTILSSATVRIPRARIVQIEGTGWSQTGWLPMVNLSGNINYHLPYANALPNGSYRYDVEFEGVAGSLQSGNITVGPTAEDYILRGDRKYQSATLQTIRMQTALALGLEYKMMGATLWNTAQVSASNDPDYPGDVVISGAKRYQFNIAVTSQDDVLQVRQPASTKVMNIPIKAGVPAGNNQWQGIAGAEIFITAGFWHYDSENKSGLLRIKKKSGIGDLEIMARYADGTKFKGTNFGQFNDSGYHESDVYYPVINDTTVAGFDARRRYERGDGYVGIDPKAMFFHLRQKNTSAPVQVISLPTFGQGQTNLVINSGTTTPDPTTEQVGALTMDLVFGVTNAYDIESRVTLEAIGRAENGQDCKVSLDDRWIGEANFTNCIAVARKTRTISPDNPDVGFHRYGISPARMRELGYTGTVRFMVEARVTAGTGSGTFIRRNLKKNGRIVAVTEVDNIDFGTTGTDPGAQPNSQVYTLTSSFKALAHLVINLDADTVSVVNITSTGGGGTNPNPTGRTRIVGTRDHGLSLDSSIDIPKYHDYWTGLKARGGNEVEFTAMNASAWTIPGERNGIESLVNKFTQLNLRGGIHLTTAFRNSTRPGWITDDMLQRWHDGNLVVDGGSVFLSLGYLDAWDNRIANPSGWNDSNPMYRWAYDYVKPIIDWYGNSVKFYTFGCQKTQETGYHTHDTNGTLDKVSGYEQIEKDRFKINAIAWSGGSMAGFNSRFGTSFSNTSDAGFTLATPGTWQDALKETYKGGGMRKATFLHRQFRVRQFQRFCEWIVRTLCGSSAQVGAEYGTTANIQAALYAATHANTLVKSADFFRENLITGPAGSDDYTWTFGPQRISSIAPNGNGRSDLDGSQFTGVQLSQYNGSVVPIDAVEKKLISALENGVDVVFFAYQNNESRPTGVTNRSFCYSLVERLANKGYPGSLHPTLTPQAQMTYSTESIRNNSGGPSLETWKQLSANGTKYVKVICQEEVAPEGWPLTL